MPSKIHNYIDSKLWRRVQQDSRGEIPRRIQAVEDIYKNRGKLPPQSFDILRKLAHKSQPYEVRLFLAKHFSISPPPTIGERSDLLRTLVEDSHGELAGIVTEEIRKFGQPPGDLLEFKERLDHLAINAASQPLSESGKSFTPIFHSLDDISQTLLARVSGYYPVSELKPLLRPAKIKPRTTGEILAEKLDKCTPGIDMWNDYQVLCKEILGYCLSPPLMEPEEQVNASGKLHRIDIVIHIPFSAKGLWNYILNRFGMAIVAECKNYLDELGENDVLISSKYLNPMGLTTLGLLLTRKGLNEGGIAAQHTLWNTNKLMIVCFNDNDLRKILELKESGDDPGKVIDDHIRNFLLSSP